MRSFQRKLGITTHLYITINKGFTYSCGSNCTTNPKIKREKKNVLSIHVNPIYHLYSLSSKYDALHRNFETPGGSKPIFQQNYSILGTMLEKTQ